MTLNYMILISIIHYCFVQETFDYFYVEQNRLKQIQM